MNLRDLAVLEADVDNVFGFLMALNVVLPTETQLNILVLMMCSVGSFLFQLEPNCATANGDLAHWLAYLQFLRLYLLHPRPSFGQLVSNQ